jgi:hypothetical protein
MMERNETLGWMATASGLVEEYHLHNPTMYSKGSNVAAGLFKCWFDLAKEEYSDEVLRNWLEEAFAPMARIAVSISKGTR